MTRVVDMYQSYMYGDVYDVSRIVNVFRAQYILLFMRKEKCQNVEKVSHQANYCLK